MPRWGNRRQVIAPRASQPKQAATPAGEAAPIEAAGESRHFDQKMPESFRIPVLFLFNLHKTLSLALFSCNGCATLGKGPKTRSPIRRWIWLILGAQGQKVAGLFFHNKRLAVTYHDQSIINYESILLRVDINAEKFSY